MVRVSQANTPSPTDPASRPAGTPAPDPSTAPAGEIPDAVVAEAVAAEPPAKKAPARRRSSTAKKAAEPAPEAAEAAPAAEEQAPAAKKPATRRTSAAKASAGTATKASAAAADKAPAAKKPAARKAPARRRKTAFSRENLVYGRIPVVDVSPAVEDGRFPAKAVPGQSIRVGATVFREGHDALGVTAVLYDPQGAEAERVPMRLLVPGTDRYEAWLTPSAEGAWSFAVEGWGDLYETWRHAAEIKVGVGQDVELMMDEGVLLFDRAAAEEGRPGSDAELFRSVSRTLADRELPAEDRLEAAVSAGVLAVVAERPVRDLVTESRRYPLKVERAAAGQGSWYEFFPRSEGAVLDAETGTWTSGTLRTAAERLEAVAGMGFDVIYLPPIHPIGRAHRKGPNNTLVAGPQDPGSPWAIGAPEGGHDAIHPDLGSFEDFDAFVARAQHVGLEVALDLALQASPDHPWVAAHPEWFTTRADGSIAYAENPPKKYQDIYPLNFDNDPEGLSLEVLRIVELWISHGVKIFRVDNPHTKPLWFWEWLIGTVNAKHPDVVFLAEAFTRPAMMQGLARVGFQQSYSYFTWRNTKQEIEEYFHEISHETSAVYRPNFFVNTPDILTEYLQFGGPAAFKVRAVLAATGSPLWGVYAGYELYEHVARPGAEEYIDNEKYEYRPRDFAGAEAAGRSLAPYLRRLNEIRRGHASLGDLQNLTVQTTSDDALVAYSKTKTVGHGEAAQKDTVIVVVNVDPHAVREGTVWLDLASLNLDDADFNEDGSFWVDDLISGESWKWGTHNYVRLDPHHEPAHVLHVRRNVK
ncbi:MULTISPECIES: alpha-1,4-glucan--maltose-1-phosphate maltosyltransferase [Kocuria]|uniref:alpha-1,4-glucan--maltose-1-phosphate maltosyltransferase n=1 Tax=Kocuria TaxID=57493 RepID=UPI0027E350A8|nr:MULTISPECIES: alpha-1,4-glucan--maltose-1-phosphate maltosyltransferase [Kocuria]